MATRMESSYRVVIGSDDFRTEGELNRFRKLVAKGMIKDELMSVSNLPSPLYHYTKKENLDSILAEGLKAGYDGGVFVGADLNELKDYLTNNIVGAEYLMTLKRKVTKNTEELEDYVILEFNPLNSRIVKWYKRFDNHNVLFYHGDLNITDVTIHEVGGEDNASN